MLAELPTPSLCSAVCESRILLLELLPLIIQLITLCENHNLIFYLIEGVISALRNYVLSTTR